MGYRYKNWVAKCDQVPVNYTELLELLKENRGFEAIDALRYGDYGLEAAYEVIKRAISENKRIALYADYDVDGTMSCVSWIWFLEALGFSNYVHYIPCRFKEGYGLNLDAIKHLIDEENAELIITMDTGITANVEAAYCVSRGVEFICTDHHKVQPDKVPDGIILNPKLHPDPVYQELCGCGITFVLLRKLGRDFKLPADTWNDLLALVGMATICDVVPLNGVNHKLANLGVQAFYKSKRPVLKSLLEQCRIMDKVDETDVGFRIGPRINAVGRLRHANQVVEAFISENYAELIKSMGECNEERKLIQKGIYEQADKQAQEYSDSKVLFMGGDWHPGVVGIAASKICEKYWNPVWLFKRDGEFCKGSARSIPGFDVTEAMMSCGELFHKFGGHAAAGGFSFKAENEEKIRDALTKYANEQYQRNVTIWESKIYYDCLIDQKLVSLDLASSLSSMKPFGHGFEEPSFEIEASIVGVRYYNDKQTGQPKHTAVTVQLDDYKREKIMFFNEVYRELESLDKARFLVTVSENTFRGQKQLSLFGRDWSEAS